MAKLEKDSEKRATRSETELERRLLSAEEEATRDIAEFEARIAVLEEELATASKSGPRDDSALKSRDAQIVKLEVALAEAIAGADEEGLREQLDEHSARATDLEEQLNEREEARDKELSRLEQKFATEIAALEQAVADAEDIRDAEVSRLEDELDEARATSSRTGTDGGSKEGISERDAKIAQKNKKLRFVAQQLEERDAEVVGLRDAAASLETELAGLRKILARKKGAAKPPATPDLSGLTPQLEALMEAASKLDSHLSSGVDEWKQLELNIGGAVSLLIRETSKDRSLQRIVNPILEELQAGLEKGRKIVKEGQALVAEERKTISELTDAVDSN